MNSADLLQLMWLASPALPIGGFSYSEGLESAVERAGLTHEDAAAAWLLDQLWLSLARAELPVAARALAAWRARDEASILELNTWMLQTRESGEFRLQTEQMGRSMMEWLRGRASGDEALQAATRLCASPTYPIAFALAASRSQASPHDCLTSLAFGWCENMVQAAVRAVPLGQSAGQRILAQLVQDIPQAVADALARADGALDTGELQAFLPMLAVRSAQHEIQYSRLFRS